MRRFALGLSFALALGGCSFIQSWGDLRGDGMDAGTDVDAGRSDAGADAAGACSFCEEDGCAGTDQCVYDPDSECFYCEIPAGDEGADCVDDVDCNPGLICELGFCLIDCSGGGAADCADSLVGDVCAIPDSGPSRRVCVNHECDPVAAECGDLACAALQNGEDPAGELASFCAVYDVTAGVGEPCDPAGAERDPTERCVDGARCVPLPGDPSRGTCRRWCHVDLGDTECTGMDRCLDPATMGGPELVYEGQNLGFCAPPPGGPCTTNEECVTRGEGQVCTGDRCSDCEPANVLAWCGVGARCEDTDGDGAFECIPPPAVCNNDAECTNFGVRPVCIDASCWYGCSADPECTSVGYDRCTPHDGRAGESVCVADCPGTGQCSDGSDCRDIDGDGRSECPLP